MSATCLSFVKGSKATILTILLRVRISCSRFTKASKGFNTALVSEAVSCSGGVPVVRVLSSSLLLPRFRYVNSVKNCKSDRAATIPELGSPPGVVTLAILLFARFRYVRLVASPMPVRLPIFSLSGLPAPSATRRVKVCICVTVMGSASVSALPSALKTAFLRLSSEKVTCCAETCGVPIVITTPRSSRSTASLVIKLL